MPQNSVGEEAPKDHLEVLKEFTKSFACAVAEDNLELLVGNRFFVYFSDDTLELNDHEHLELVARTPCEVKAFTLKLVDSVS